MSKVHLIGGGKTTFAKELAQDIGAVYFSVDLVPCSAINAP